MNLRNAVKGWQLQGVQLEAGDILDATIGLADLDNPEAYTFVPITANKYAANQGWSTVAQIRLPASGILTKVTCELSDVTNLESAVFFRLRNSSGTVLTATGAFDSTNQTIVSVAVSNTVATQGAAAAIQLQFKTSTTASALGINCGTWWKFNHTD